jgi:hypothetical protein
MNKFFDLRLISWVLLTVTFAPSMRKPTGLAPMAGVAMSQSIGGALQGSAATDLKPNGTPEKKSSMSAAKDITEAFKNLSEAVGIIVGGIWTWMLFVKKRLRFPRAELTHRIMHRVLADGQRLLHLDVVISNTGECLLSLISGKTWIQQMEPVPEEFLDMLRKQEDLIKEGQTEYEWPLLAERETDWTKEPVEIEPGETHQITYDLVVDSDAGTVEIYTYFKNARRKDREIGWTLTSIYDFNSNVVQDLSSHSGSPESTTIEVGEMSASPRKPVPPTLFPQSVQKPKPVKKRR